MKLRFLDRIAAQIVRSSWPRFMGGMIASLAGAILCFAAIYMALGDVGSALDAGSPVDALVFSGRVMFVLVGDDMRPRSPGTLIVMFSEMCFAFFYLALFIGAVATGMVGADRGEMER